ncbi:MAG: hypothetical protein IKG74_02470, partial [Firmicutes bacterium]|nr:hypothetical protein [Bacillota bacterium]
KNPAFHYDAGFLCVYVISMALSLPIVYPVNELSIVILPHKNHGELSLFLAGIKPLYPSIALK